MAGNLDDPQEIISAILELLNPNGEKNLIVKLKRLDGEFHYKGTVWKYSAYKVNQPVELIRIDIRKKDK